MKSLIRISVLLIALVLCQHQRAGAQLTGFSSMFFCGMTVDSLALYDTSYVAGDSVEMYYGDGTSAMIAPFYTSGTMGYFGDSHSYSSAGTYTLMAVLIRSGARIDSVTTIAYFVPCTDISLAIYNDVNSDCMLDAGDVSYFTSPAEVEVDSAGTPVDTQWTSGYMWYHATGPVGTTYTFKVLTNPHGFLPSCPTTGSVSTTVASYYSYIADTIGFTCDPTACLDNAVYGYTDLAIHNGRIDAYVVSSSCTSTSATLDVTFSPKYSLASASGGSSYSVSGNVVTFTFSSLSVINPGFVTLQLLPAVTLSYGDTAHTTFKLNPYSGDCDTTNNYIATVDTIRSSWDPNYKSVSPEGSITAGTRLQYTIGFENTGNATARNIHILDTLSDNLDVNSIKIMSASAQCVMSILTYSGHNIVKFDFADINLLDSTHHNQCTGLVVFSINSKSSLAPATKIDNRAGIYFDDNAVVMTTPVENVIRSSTGIANVKSAAVDVYPNPVSGNLYISTDAGMYSTFTICNTLAQTVITSAITNNLTSISVKALPTGIYYLNLRGDGGVKVVKFVKE